MSNKRTLIAVAGVGDLNPFYERIVGHWREEFDIDLNLYSFGFQDIEHSFEEKLEKFLQFINSFEKPVSILGFSAGGVVSCLALANLPDKVFRVVTFSSPMDEYFILNLYCDLLKKPALVTAVRAWKAIEPSLPNETRSNIMTVRSYYDSIVPVKKSIIAGANDLRFLCAGHYLGGVVGTYLKEKEIVSFLFDLSFYPGQDQGSDKPTASMMV